MKQCSQIICLKRYLLGSKVAVITNEEIKKNGGTVKIQFTNLSGRFYRSKSGEYALSVTADGIEVIS